MTMPHLMNCPHKDDGWCLACVKELWEEKEKFRLQAETLRQQDDKHLNDEGEPSFWGNACSIDEW